MTESEFINWIRDNKGVDIKQRQDYSTLGELGTTYQDKEGNSLYYGLSVVGFPPHLELMHIKINCLFIFESYKNQYSYIQKTFYSEKYNNEERYLMLTNKKILTLKKPDHKPS